MSQATQSKAPQGQRGNGDRPRRPRREPEEEVCIYYGDESYWRSRKDIEII